MQEKNEEKSNDLENLSPEERRNLVGFFALLLKVDKRINPSLYTNKKIQNYDRHDKSTYTTR